ncbi:hypothetical protein LSPH24S_03413 [Lysinibacillus sphaericus]
MQMYLKEKKLLYFSSSFLCCSRINLRKEANNYSVVMIIYWVFDKNLSVHLKRLAWRSALRWNICAFFAIVEDGSHVRMEYKTTYYSEGFIMAERMVGKQAPDFTMEAVLPEQIFW